MSFPELQCISGLYTRSPQDSTVKRLGKLIAFNLAMAKLDGICTTLGKIR